MREILESNSHIMVGEIGLDKHHPNIETQIKFLEKQIEIAIEFNRPIHLHCIGAWDKILHILKGHNKSPLPPIIAHAFDGGHDIMTRLITKYDVYFSYKTKKTCINNIINGTPIERILVESDCNTPTEQLKILQDTTHEIAKLCNISEPKLNTQINKNFQRIINYA